MELQDEVVLENDNGVRIDAKFQKHWGSSNAQCWCGEGLLVAPRLFHADHKRGNPVMVCEDHGVHAFRFSELVVGRQPAPEGREDAKV